MGCFCAITAVPASLLSGDPRSGAMARSLALLSLLLASSAAAAPLTDLKFERSPETVISYLEKPVTLHCSLTGMWAEEQEPPDVFWLKDEETLDFAETNQLVIRTGSSSWTITSTLKIQKVHLLDMGSYRCAVQSESERLVSEEGSIQLEGIPHFSVEPQHMTVVANVSFSLSCAAHGPPDPVKVIWLQDGAPLNTLEDHLALSPSTLNLTGLNRTSTFSCEAHNSKGVSTSGSGTVTVLPSPPQNLSAVEANQTSLRLSWQPGFGGDYPIVRCSVQAKQSAKSFPEASDEAIYKQNVNMPPASLLLEGLEPHSLYAVRVACQSSQGVSEWSSWAELQTGEGVPENPPVNVTAKPNGTEVLLAWEAPPGKLNGNLQGFLVEYSTPSDQQTVVSTRLDTVLSINLTAPLSNITFRVCAYTAAGLGPWTPPQTLVLTPAGTEKIHGPPPAFSWHWWYVVMAIAGAVAIAALLAVYVAKLRRKETRFGEAFEPMMESGELVVRYRARRTYSRRTTEATLNSLGISDELKQKLQDVMVDRHKLTLGKTLGEGEFGSVMEGLLTQEDSVLKVAVKTMKIAICTRSEMEDFLREAACMKEFDHGNVMRLLDGGERRLPISRGHPALHEARRPAQLSAVLQAGRLSRVPPVTNADQVHDRHRPRYGVPQRQELHPQRPGCAELHAEREHERLRGRLRPLQEDLQRRLLPAGPDLQDAGEMDRHRKLGGSRLHHQERRVVIRGHHVGDRHSRSDAVPWRGKQRDLRLSEAGEPPQAAARLSGFDILAHVLLLAAEP